MYGYCLLQFGVPMPILEVVKFQHAHIFFFFKQRFEPSKFYERITNTRITSSKQLRKLNTKNIPMKHKHATNLMQIAWALKHCQ